MEDVIMAVVGLVVGYALGHWRNAADRWAAERERLRYVRLASELPTESVVSTVSCVASRAYGPGADRSVGWMRGKY